MRLHILGPLEVHDAAGVPVEVTGLKRRALLAALVVRAGRTVSTERLIAELWGERPPANAANALQAQMRRLRRVIEEACGEPDRIVTRPPGYVLALRAGESDAVEFVGQVEAATGARRRRARRGRCRCCARRSGCGAGPRWRAARSATCARPRRWRSTSNG